MPELYWYDAEVTRVVDGDTIDVQVDLGFEVFTKKRLRLAGINAPEIHGVSRDSDEYKRGMAATAFVKHWVSTQAGEKVRIRSIDGRHLVERGKYGRWLAQIWSTDGSQCLNDLLIENRLAVPYFGGKR